MIAAFVAKHGEQILMAPQAEGFNLAGYLVPGIVILAVGGVTAVVLGQASGGRQSDGAGPSVRLEAAPAVRRLTISPASRSPSEVAD